MSLFYSSKHKVRNIYRVIDGLLDGDFPLPSGKLALKRIRAAFTEQENKLLRAHRLKDQDSIEQIASVINVKVFQALPILGFIVRSTNVRNAFELLYPLQSLADATLQGRPQLLLSSEWDYVPFAYPQSLDDLKSFVLIGLPASEAASALLIPLSAHELGHAVWRNRGINGSAHATLQIRCEDLFAKNLAEFKKHFPDYDPTDIVNKELLPEATAQSVEYAVLHAEELFCDLFAYSLFGESYVRAFGYILSPGSGATRRPGYPTYKTRIDLIRQFAKLEGVELPDVAELSFKDETDLGNPRDRFIIKMAETSVLGIVNGLWSNIVKLLQEGNVVRPNLTETLSHLQSFKNGIPAHDPSCLGNIINAGWKFCVELQASSGNPETISDALDQLNEVLLKSIEVMEYNRRTAGK